MFAAPAFVVPAVPAPPQAARKEEASTAIEIVVVVLRIIGPLLVRVGGQSELDQKVKRRSKYATPLVSPMAMMAMMAMAAIAESIWKFDVLSCTT